MGITHVYFDRENSQAIVTLESEKITADNVLDALDEVLTFPSFECELIHNTCNTDYGLQEWTSYEWLYFTERMDVKMKIDKDALVDYEELFYLHEYFDDKKMPILVQRACLPNIDDSVLNDVVIKPKVDTYTIEVGRHNLILNIRVEFEVFE